MALGSFTLMMVGAFGVAVVLRHYEQGLPSVDELRHYQPPQVTRVLAADGSLLGELFTERRTVVPIEEIPAVMKRAVLAAEDARFYEHAGLDYVGMLRALWVNVRSGTTRQGGSTITQQVVKNFLLTPERTFERKAREVLLARRLEQELSKDEILELYLNHIYLGHGRYGVEEAARFYFGKRVAEVTLAEAALIAGLAKGPSVYSPRVDPKRALGRRNHVLDQLELQGLASRADVARAREEPLLLAPEPEELPGLAPEVVDSVRRLLQQVVGDDAVRGGYTVRTTIDASIQSAARSALRHNLDQYAERHGLVAPFAPPKPKGKTSKKKRAAASSPAPFEGVPKATGHHVYRAVVLGSGERRSELRVRVGTAEGTVDLGPARRYNPKSLPADRFAEPGTVLRVSPIQGRGVGADGLPTRFRLELGPEGAMVVIDPRNRHIVALVGSYEAIRGGLDRTTQAFRQPGSAFKPIVYGYGIQSRRLTTATPLGDPPTPSPADPSRPSVAHNGDGAPTATLALPKQTPEQPLPPLLREALAKSVNSAAVWALNQVGPRNVVQWARSLGIHSKLGADESLALGAYELSPLELAGAYATFAAGGVYEQPILVTSIVGPDGVELELPATPPPRRAMDEAAAFVLTDALRSVVERGTGRRARSLGFDVVGKTGTSNDARDAWFAGYSADLVCVVWTGYDDAVPLGARESGATAALPAWIELMRQAHEGKPRPSFASPADIVTLRIDPATGLRAREDQEDAVEERFVAGTQPTTVAPAPEPEEELDGGVEAVDEVSDDEPADRPSDEDPESPAGAQDAREPDEPSVDPPGAPAEERAPEDEGQAQPTSPAANPSPTDARPATELGLDTSADRLPPEVEPP